MERAVDDDGHTFAEFLADAQQIYRDARRRSGATRKPVIPAGRGFAPALRETLDDELPALPGEEPIAIEWRKLPDDVFFDIDRDTRTIALNRRYRTALNGGRRGTVDDAPMVKALMFFLLHEVFGKEYNGPRTKDNLQLWQSVLLSAARAEFDQAEA
ncbi:hypothetical protein [Nocardia sp. SSK8]|uniref:hypothetical protein n=1 Tax=Nocardia sp. SSK8 TaxID=3120154 RepID=UPI00300B2B8F